MPIIDLDTTPIHYSIATSDGAGERRDVVALHSFLTSSQVWQPMVPFLPPGVRLVAPDTRNHGRSARTPDGVTIDGHVRDVVRLIEALHLDRPLVIGSSIGATYATELALRRPDLVSGAVIVGGMAHGAHVVPGLGDAITAQGKGFAAARTDTANDVVPSWFGPLVGRSVHAWAVRQIEHTGVDALRILDEALAYDPRPRLPAATVPITFVHGRHDGIPMTIPTECAALVPHATMVVAEPAGHMPHVEIPGWFTDVIADALERAG